MGRQKFSIMKWRPGDPLTFKAPAKMARAGTQQFIEELKKHPGKWAVFQVGGLSNNTTNYSRRYAGTEWIARRVRNFEIEVFARWVGLRGEHAGNDVSLSSLKDGARVDANSAAWERSGKVIAAAERRRRRS
jgi:hypothetical protein